MVSKCVMRSNKVMLFQRVKTIGGKVNLLTVIIIAVITGIYIFYIGDRICENVHKLVIYKAKIYALEVSDQFFRGYFCCRSKLSKISHQ